MGGSLGTMGATVIQQDFECLRKVHTVGNTAIFIYQALGSSNVFQYFMKMERLNSRILNI